MTINYVGESKYGKADRFAVIVAKVTEEDEVVAIIEELEYSYDGFGDSEESIIYVSVEDQEDFKYFSKWFRKIRKERQKKM